MTTQSKGKALAKAAVMQPKYRTQVVQSRKAYRRKSAKAATQKTLQSEGFVVMGRPFAHLTCRGVRNLIDENAVFGNPPLGDFTVEEFE